MGRQLGGIEVDVLLESEVAGYYGEVGGWRRTCGFAKENLFLDGAYFYRGIELNAVGCTVSVSENRLSSR